MIKGIIYDEPAIVGLIAPLADEEVELLLLLILTLFDAKHAFINVLLEGNELMVDRIAIQQILLKYAICPRPEEDALR